MSPHPGYGMTPVPSEYPTNPYTPYPASSYGCGTVGSTSYSGPVTSGYHSAPGSGGGYSPNPCYSMPPPQHSLQPHDKNGTSNKDGRCVKLFSNYSPTNANFTVVLSNFS